MSPRASRVSDTNSAFRTIARFSIGYSIERQCQFDNGNIYADDAPPTGRLRSLFKRVRALRLGSGGDRRAKRFARKVRPSLKTQMRLWWDIVTEDGYGYNWGRSQGVVSYLDTPEIVGFLASHPEFRPAPLADIAALYYQAWNYLHNDYRTDAHLLSIFSFGRGNYGYISRDREWQQTTGFFGKLANSHTPIVNALEKEGVASFPVVPSLREVMRFEFFRRVAGAIGGCLGSAPGDVAVRVADHDWSKTGNVRLFTGAVWLAGFCGACRADLSVA